MSKRTGTYTTGKNRTAPMWKRKERDFWERTQAGYCEHGVYVGGCGIDWMCGRCESGEQPLTKAERKKYDRTRKANYHLGRVLYFLKRNNWDKANEAFTLANRCKNSREWTGGDRYQLVVKTWLEYARVHDKFKEAEAA